jgi:primosomal protein N' (replication factor Y)
LTEAGRAALTDKDTLAGDVAALLKRLARRPAGIAKGTMLRRKGSSQRRQLESLIENGWAVEVQGSTTRIADTQALSGYLPSIIDHRALVWSRVPSDWEHELTRAVASLQFDQLALQAPLQDRMSFLSEAIRQTVALGRSALVITGEAERAEWIVDTLCRSQPLTCACYHSGKAREVLAGIWAQAHRFQLIVGTRSALFLPLQKLGLVWVDREEDPALKEPQEPRYHAREVARIRARHEQAVLVIGSSHLSLETSAAAERTGTYLRHAAENATRPAIEVVDLRVQDRNSVLSGVLIDALEQSIQRRTGAILFLNRKGYAGALICRDCGEVPRCQSCLVAMTYYRLSNRLLCAYCGGVLDVPVTCSSCAGRNLQLIGEGTERVEAEVVGRFPQAKVIRADGETMHRPAQAQAIWTRIAKCDWDVLVGTQLILRDYAVPKAGLVGVVQADAVLNLPDFRAAERTYHQLLDAVSLAHPSAAGGRVVLQTYLPSHHAIQSVARFDEHIFAAEELSHRTTLGYPPAVHLIALHVSGEEDKLVAEAAEAWVAELRILSAPQTTTDDREAFFTLLGPVPSPIPRRRGKIRFQILVKSPDRNIGVQAVKTTIERLERTYWTDSIKFEVDVDPVDMA